MAGVFAEALAAIAVNVTARTTRVSESRRRRATWLGFLGIPPHRGVQPVYKNRLRNTGRLYEVRPSLGLDRWRRDRARTLYVRPVRPGRAGEIMPS